MRNSLESEHPIHCGPLTFATSGEFENACDLLGVTPEALRNAGDGWNSKQSLAGLGQLRQPSPRNLEKICILRAGRGLLATSALNRLLVGRGGLKAKWLRHGPLEFNQIAPRESRADYRRYVALTAELPLGLELCVWQRDAPGWEVCSGISDELPEGLLRGWRESGTGVRVFSHREPPNEKWLEQLGDSGIVFDMTEVEGDTAPPKAQGKLLLSAPKRELAKV